MLKRLFDIFVSLTALLLLGWLMLLGFVLASIDTRSNGFFLQQRVGQHGKLFTIYKLKTIHPQTRQISTIGRCFRKYKIDELPQSFNILLCTMSLAGYRPDVPRFY